MRWPILYGAVVHILQLSLGYRSTVQHVILVYTVKDRYGSCKSFRLCDVGSLLQSYFRQTTVVVQLKPPRLEAADSLKQQKINEELLSLYTSTG